MKKEPIVKEFKSYVNVAHESMIVAVISGCLSSDNVAITNSVPVFATYINGLQININLVDTLRASIARPITGYAAQNRALKNLISVLCTNVMGSVFSYAIDNGNTVLAGEMKTATTSLEKVKNRLFVGEVQGILDLINPIVGSLGTYNVTLAMLTTISSFLTEFSAQTSDPRTAITFRKTVNTQIQNVLKGCMDTLFNNCDRLAVQFRADHPDYYNNYRNNRKLVPSTKSTQLRMHVINGLGQPVTNGEVFIIGTDRSASLNSKGYALVDHIPFGDRQVSVTTPEGNMTSALIDFKKGHSVTLHFQVGVIPPPVADSTSTTVTTTEKSVVRK